MIEFILVIIMVTGFLILGIPLPIWERHLGKKSSAEKNTQSLRIIQPVFHLILKVVGVYIIVKGLENVPTDRAVLYVGNHHSYFDILVGYITVPIFLGSAAKKEMEHYSLLSSWMHNANCLFLDRENLKKGLKTILIGIERVKWGTSIWIFPEGTCDRNEDILEFLPFRGSSLKIVEKSGCPIVPVAMTGTAGIFEKQFPRMKSSNVTIEFGTPIIIRDLESGQKKRAGAYTQSIIKDMLAREKATREDK